MRRQFQKLNRVGSPAIVALGLLVLTLVLNIESCIAAGDCSQLDVSNLINLQVNVIDSANCSPFLGDPNPQDVTQTVNVNGSPDCTFTLQITVEGKVEQQNWGYDYVFVNGQELFSSDGFGNGCTMVTKTNTVTITVRGGDPVTLEYNTIDGNYHSAAYAKIDKVTLVTNVNLCFDAPKSRGAYVIKADGEATATAFLDNPGFMAAPITWTMDDPNGTGCIFDPATQLVTASTNEGSITVRATDATGLSREAQLELKKCPSCDCSGAGGTDCEDNSVDVKIGLGWAAVGDSAGYLQIKEEAPSNQIAKLTALHYRFTRSDVEVLTNAQGLLQQVKGPDGLANIATNSDFKYTVSLFALTNVLAKTNGFYQLVNSPFSTVTVENPGNDTNLVRVTQTREGTDTVSDYAWNGSGWELTTGGGLRKEVKTTVWSQTNTVRTVTTSIQQGSGSPVFTRVETLQRFPLGERLIQQIIGTGGNPLTNSYSYTSNGFVQQVVRSDGSWEYYLYDSNNRPTNVFSGFLNQGITTNKALCRMIEYTYSTNVVAGSGDFGIYFPRTARRAVEYLLGQEIRRSYFLGVPSGTRQISCVTTGAAWNASNNLVAITRFFPNGSHQGETQEIIRPDGTADIYQYDFDGNFYTDTVFTGHLVTNGLSIDQGTKSVAVRDLIGNTLSRTAVDILSTFTTSQETYQYDSFKRLLTTTYLDGTSSQTAYNCCTVTSTTDRDGTVATYGADALKRIVTTMRSGVTVSNVLDANGNVLAAVRYGTDGTTVTNNLATYDDAGRRTSSTDALNQTTTYTNYTDGIGQTVRITTFPDLSTRIETYATDRSLLKTTGTAVHPVRYQYGVEPDGGLQRTYVKEIMLDGSEADTAEWIKSYSDMLGRQYKTVFASAVGAPASQSFYNNAGQLSKDLDPDGESTLYQYNAKGQLEYTAVDLYGDGLLHQAGTNRVTRKVTAVVNNTALGAIVQQSLTYVWPTDNLDFPRLVTAQESSVDGLHSWNTVWNNGVAITNRTDFAYAGNGVRYITNTAADGSCNVSTYQNGRLVSTVSKDALGSQITATSYGYDAHGRRNTATDARNGITTQYFNAADQVTGTLTPAPGPGQAAELTTQYYDLMGRVWKSTLPDNTCVTNEFFVTGELKKTYGSRTYPVEYTYDAQGRMKTMTTWTNFALGLGAAVTTWNYDGYRGFMTNKIFADGNGPIYSYTASGRLQTRTWARGILTSYGYNAAGDLATVIYTDGITANVTNRYDRQGRNVAVNHGSSSYNYVYNDAGELLTESTVGGPLNGLTMTNGYDALLRRAALTLNSQQSVLGTTTYTYDEASRLLAVASGQDVVTYGYTPNSTLVSSMTFWHGGAARMTTTRSYDNLNRLTSISSSSSQPLTVNAFNYGYNSLDQRMTATNSDNSRWNYQYDNLGQVITGKKYWSDGTAVAGQQFEYVFDDIGNRSTTKAGGDAAGANLRSAVYVANNLNQYTSRTVPGAIDILGTATNSATVSVNGQTTYRNGDYYWKELALDNTTGAVYAGVTNNAVLGAASVTNVGNAFLPQSPETFAYDLDGNLTNDGRWTLTWDAENRLVSMVSLAAAPGASKQKLDFSYDNQGRRIQKTVSIWNGSGYVAQVTNRFAYDGWNLLSVLNPDLSVQMSFTWGLDLSGSMQNAGGVGGLLAVGSSTNGTQFASFDGNGNVTALVSANDGTLVAQYEYGPFGELLRTTGPAAKTNPFRFSTKYQDDESKLLYYGHRYYNPNTGTWISRDPIEELGGKNLYGFVANDPNSRVDRFGLFFWGPLAEFALNCAKSITKEYLYQYLGNLIKDAKLCEVADDYAGANLFNMQVGKAWSFDFADDQLKGKLLFEEDDLKLWKLVLECVWSKVSKMGKEKSADYLIEHYGAKMTKIQEDILKEGLDKAYDGIEKAVTKIVKTDVKVGNHADVSCNTTTGVSTVSLTRTTSISVGSKVISIKSDPYNSGGCSYLNYRFLGQVCPCQKKK